MQRIKTNGSAVLRTTQCAPAQVRHTRTAGRVGSDSSVLLFTRSLTRPHMLERAQHATTRVATAHSAVSCKPEALRVPKQQFDWFKAWYPLAVLEDLDPALPSHFTLLGMDLAVWWDRGAAKWRAFQDRCPHRLAPLSEGRVDAASGHLFCNYHGWTFDGSGACTSIPQLPEGQPISARKACVASFPTCEREGLLWVWADSSPAALAESTAEGAWPGLAPELDDQGEAAFSGSHKWYCRDLPTSYLAVKENAFNDCSHDTVLHHGAIFVLNRDNAAPVSMKLAEMTSTGYTVREATGRFSDTTRFPCGARRNGTGFVGVSYAVPTGVGTCRQIHTFLKGTSPQKRSDLSAVQKTLFSLLMLFQAGQPTWLQHMGSHILVDADVAMQARVDVNRAVSDHVYMPAAADAGPGAFMRWLKEYGGGGPPVAKLSDPFMGQAPAVPSLSRQQLLDRFHSHTQHCKACRTAYQRTLLARRVVGVLALLAGSAALTAAALLAGGAVVIPGTDAAATAAAGQGVQVVAALSAVGALAGCVWAGLGRLLQSFVFVDYGKHHPSKN